ncbi:MAG TPA: glycosyltransferase [Anaeromyxobacter sp.]|nr:glycosyltransferase [Anaeromyxobacter sp.]
MTLPRPASARPRVVYVCPESPYPRSSGGRFRIDAIRRALSAAADVRLVVVGDRPPLDARQKLRAEGGRVFPAKRETRFQWAARCVRAALRREPIPAGRYLSARRVERLAAHVRSLAPGLVLLGDVYLTALLPALRPLGARIAVDTHDAASLVHARIAAAAGSLGTRLAYRVLSANTEGVERRMLPLVDELWTASEDDARFYRERIGLARVEVVPNVVDFPPRPPTLAPEEPGAVAFTGSFTYWPNEDAALRLVELTRPLAAAGVVSRVYLVGVGPTARMRAAAAAAPHVVVTGRVPEMAPWFARAAVIAAPLAAGSGTKLKVLEAMAAARPVLTTPIGAEGLGLTPGVHAEVAPLEGFARVLGELLRDPARQARLAAAGREWAEARYSMGVLERIVGARLAALLGEPSRRSAR